MRFIFSIGLALFSTLAQSETISFFHTNDLHTHFRPAVTRPHWGGIARLKTLLDERRAQVDRSLLFDGGDWSEGQVYFIPEAGRPSIQMLSDLGYDAAVVGNHDWLNGPEALLDLLENASSSTSFLGANVDLSKSEFKKRFKKTVLPYQIFTLGKFKIGVFGLLTYEVIYDDYFRPVKITSPIETAKKMVEELSSQVDFIVGISHNQTFVNHQILEKIPEINLIIGGHDHQAYPEPIIVRHGDQVSWLVEAGKWGERLGEVQLSIENNKLQLKEWFLHPVHPGIVEDQKILEYVEKIEKQIEKIKGPWFHKVHAHSKVEIKREGHESPIGNLVTDAFRLETQSDVALDQVGFIYGELPKGALSSAHFFNALPGIYQHDKKRTWEVYRFLMRGSDLNWIFHLFHSTPALLNRGILSFSGVKVQLSKNFTSLLNLFKNFAEGFFTPIQLFLKNPIEKILIGEKPINSYQYYQVAASEGILQSLRFLERILPGGIPLKNLQSTRRESWEILQNYIEKKKIITHKDLHLGTHFVLPNQDLAIYSSGIEQITNKNEILLKITIFNHGKKRSNPQEIIISNLNFFQQTLSIPIISPYEERVLNVLIPKNRIHPLFPIKIILPKNKSEVYTANQEVNYWPERF